LSATEIAVTTRIRGWAMSHDQERLGQQRVLRNDTCTV